MDLWPAYSNEAKKPTFGSVRLLLNTGKRHHTSLAMVSDTGTSLNINTAAMERFSEPRRYILAKEITYDVLVSLYDVNTMQAIAMRISKNLQEKDMLRIIREIRKRGFGNIEIRIIGMQGLDPELQGVIYKLKAKVPGRLMELDLFGNEIRHIAIDMKTGASYDLLLENRHYAPAELINKESPGDFAQKRSQLAFP